jgi:hypothetical protein
MNELIPNTDWIARRVANGMQEWSTMSVVPFQASIALLLADGISHRQLLFGLCLMVALAVIAANREARKAFWAPTYSQGNATAAPAMRPSRLLIVYALGAAILGGSLFSWVTDTEHWPFSPYPMFSWLSPRTDFLFATLRLYGVTQEQPLSEFPLDRNEYLEPFDNSRLPAALDIAVREDRLTPVLKDCLERYEALRVSGIHQGPTIRALRLYRVTWNLNAQASNVGNPGHRELLGEFSEARAKEQPN